MSRFTARSRARAGEPFRVVDDQRGSPTSTSDLASALVRLAEAGQYGTYDRYLGLGVKALRVSEEAR